MRFSIDGPVAGRALFDRKRELRRSSESCIESVRSPGERCFFALLGIRKVGKSTILHELKRRYEDVPDLYVVILDCYGHCQNGDDFSKYYAVQVMNEFLIRQGHEKQVGLFPPPQETAYLDLLEERIEAVRSLGSEALHWGTRALEILAQRQIRDHERQAAYHTILGLAQKLAEEAGVYFQLIFDEFQEVARLNSRPEVKSALGNVFAQFRSRGKWTISPPSSAGLPMPGCSGTSKSTASARGSSACTATGPSVSTAWPI